APGSRYPRSLHDALPICGDRSRTDLPYLSGDEADAPRGHDWYRTRHLEALTPDTIARQAASAADRYGFRDFKLKGGVMHGSEEIDRKSTRLNSSHVKIS